MKPLTREWIEKAEGDYEAAGLLLRARKHPNYDASCFHAQQCVEKWMKAMLIEAGIQFERTHDLPALLDLLRAVNRSWELLRPAATTLSDYAVRFRYPGSSADKPMAKIAFQACKLVRETLREHLGMSPASSRKPKRGPRKRRQSKSKSG
ncbi:MAG: HEPN domain-containing protein [Planctomycetes bacterium]|nr:HEPN domain-containing protein [Planctomycetota bacterium]